MFGWLFGPLRRAAAGAAFMDQQSKGWVEKVSPKTLDIERGDICVLGQLYGKYGEGIKKLGISDSDAQRLGFLMLGVEWACFDAWLLTRAWRHQIWLRRRRFAPPLAPAA
jgi:hypothetical protein